jgi:hypothetical protein
MSGPLDLTQTCPKIADIVGPVLAELQTVIPGLVVMPPTDDWANAAPPAIWWMPLDEERGAPRRQGEAGAPGLLAVRMVPVAFLLFGGVAPTGTYPDAEVPFHVCDLTEAMGSHLENVLQRRLSASGWQFLKQTWFPPERTGIGMAAELQIKLQISLLREDNPTAKATDARITVEIENP